MSFAKHVDISTVAPDTKWARNLLTFLLLFVILQFYKLQFKHFEYYCTRRSHFNRCSRCKARKGFNELHFEFQLVL